jgi:hypothetical protein
MTLYRTGNDYTESHKHGVQCRSDTHPVALAVQIASRSQATGQQSKADTKHSVFVGNLPFDVDEEELRKHFEGCGIEGISFVRIVRDPKVRTRPNPWCMDEIANRTGKVFSLRFASTSLQWSVSN